MNDIAAIVKAPAVCFNDISTWTVANQSDSFAQIFQTVVQKLA